VLKYFGYFHFNRDFKYNSEMAAQGVGCSILIGLVS